MMRWLLTPIMRPIALRKLDRLYPERIRIEAAINRAKASKGRVPDLYVLAKQVNIDCNRWEKWL